MFSTKKIQWSSLLCFLHMRPQITSNQWIDYPLKSIKFMQSTIFWFSITVQAVCWIILVLEVYSRVHFWLISSPYYCRWKICWFLMNQNKSVATLAEQTTKYLNASKQAGLNPVGSMHISYIHKSLNVNKINLILNCAATNMQWKNLKALTS